MVQVASIRGKSGAGIKAWSNLQQADSALQNYSQQVAQVDARNAADVQQQAQQLEAEIKRLHGMKSDTASADDDTRRYFTAPAAGQPSEDDSHSEPLRGEWREQAAETTGTAPNRTTDGKSHGRGRTANRSGETGSRACRNAD